MRIRKLGQTLDDSNSKMVLFIEVNAFIIFLKTKNYVDPLKKDLEE